MPIIKSAKKKLEIGKRNYAQNLKYKEALKKAVQSYLKEKDLKKKEKKLKAAFSIVDKSAKIHLIHKNKAARIKSNLIKNPYLKIIKKRKRIKRSQRRNKKKK